MTTSEFDNIIYGCRHSVIDGLNRATDVNVMALRSFSNTRVRWRHA